MQQHRGIILLVIVFNSLLLLSFYVQEPIAEFLLLMFGVLFWLLLTVDWFWLDLCDYRNSNSSTSVTIKKPEQFAHNNEKFFFIFPKSLSGCNTPDKHLITVPPYLAVLKKTILLFPKAYLIKTNFFQYNKISWKIQRLASTCFLSFIWWLRMSTNHPSFIIVTLISWMLCVGNKEKIWTKNLLC